MYVQMYVHVSTQFFLNRDRANTVAQFAFRKVHSFHRTGSSIAGLLQGACSMMAWYSWLQLVRPPKPVINKYVYI